MSPTVFIAFFFILLVLAYAAWRRYLWASEVGDDEAVDTCEFSLTEVFASKHPVNVPHQKGVSWLTEIFSRSVSKYPKHTALQIPHTGESLTFTELDQRAESIASALSGYITGPDQVVAVAMSQDNWQIVAAHLGVLKAGGTLMFLDTSLPEILITHMLKDAQPVVILTRGQQAFRELPTLDVLALPEKTHRRIEPTWLDDPSQRLATLFYTSGTTGMPKGVECHHAGYVNLALSYAEYFDLIPGMDATSLTSSLGYDGCISEMYSAWVSGCSVVMLTKDQVRSGPDLLGVLRDAEVTVLFCPPVLLTTLTPNPQVDLPYPLCRYIVPAGEAFPAALVEPWTRGKRQVINTYGPTEASTDTSRQSLRPGEPVTIGSPLANVTYVILEPGQLKPLPHGEAGELCIGGVHVGRGYRNLPGQTAEKFIQHPRFGRLYRTGDRCRIDIRSQQVHFLGRIDTQLKVRGHRVEVQPVEDILQTQFSEIEAAVLDYQNQELVAFVVAPSIADSDIPLCVSAPRVWAKRVTRALTGQLPSASVPSRIFLVKEFVMKPVSGKIDRQNLPDLSHPGENNRENPAGGLDDSSGYQPQRDGADAAVTDTPLDPGELQVLEICRDVFHATMAWDDVFSDHGGHSVVIAQLASRLQAAGWQVPVRSLLSECNTARKIAVRSQEFKQSSTTRETSASKIQPDATRDEAATKVLSPVVFTTLQLLFLLLLFAPALIGFLSVVAYMEIGKFFMTAYLWEFIVVGFILYLAALTLPFSNLLWVMFLKLILGGHVYRNRVRPGIYPKWSRMHLRSWYVRRMEQSVLVPFTAMFRSAPLMAYVLRRLGANVGKNLQCSHDVEFSGPLDLLSIEDDVAIQARAYVHMSRWLGQELHIGNIFLGAGCKIGMRAGVSIDVSVGQGSWITPFTPILHDVSPGEIWEGSPAKLAGRCMALKRTAGHCRYLVPAWLLETGNILMQVVFDFLLIVVPTALVTWFATHFIPIQETAQPSDYFRITSPLQIIWHLGLYAFITTWVTVVLVSVLGSLFLRLTPAGPGLYPSRGIKAALLLYRMKVFNRIQHQWTWTVTGQYLRALAGVRFSRLGASECDVMFNLVPELASADARVFWSNGCFTNMLDYGAEHIKLRQLDMPLNFFSGNNSVAECGHFPSNFLLGVSTAGDDIRFRRQMVSRAGEPVTIAGNPPIEFVSTQADAQSEKQRLPSLPLFLARVFLNDFFSVGILRIAHVLVYVILYTVLLRLDGSPVVSALIALVFTELILVMACALIKKILVGKNWGSDHSTPFWSWRHFSYFFAQDCFFIWSRVVLGLTAGTLLSNTVLRWMGCKIGKRTIVNSPMQASDWNAVKFGDDCIVAGFLQFHTFENMMLKLKSTEIRDGCAINFGATVMGGAVIGAGTTLQPLSMVLKEMNLKSAIYSGSPAAPVISKKYPDH